ncbi:hypothetical protein CANARDRAFT_202655 [[Candida] arabinofermentans NRRL YB-2248]|uniref:Tr-type G domain-containing protein n=1 Tax=[Candida] arabinofermentans NRRL YB-2248 TaxID=983967 RepID=A0A1E4SW36_9ASCO|nr:hypothetical protein CANARDRAFT_202655 [[Candida] arabinofermentans NRRL YB-2248]
MTDVFGPDVETIIATTDAQDMNEPIVAPQLDRSFKIEEKELPPTFYSKEYMWDLLSLPSKVRNIALCGSLHSGKTSFLDLLINETHDLQTPINLKNYKPLRYTDNHKLEINRGLSIKASIMSLLLPDLEGNSLVCNFIDAPGHVNFADEMAAAIRITDTVVLVVDVIEGVTKGLELAIEHALKVNAPLSLIINKIDRLILELRLPPLDAYFKIRRVIDEVNQTIEESKYVKNNTYKHSSRLSPELGNTCFASSTLNFCFSLRSFSELYIETHGLSVSLDAFATKMWGDIYYTDKKFTAKPSNPTAMATQRTFIKFILDPIYKIVTHTLTKEPKELKMFLQEQLGITSIHKSKFKLDMQLLLKEVFAAFFGKCSIAFSDMVKHQPSPLENASTKFESIFGLPRLADNDEIKQHVAKCDPLGPLIAYVTRLVDTKDASRFYAQVRVLSGTLSPGSSVQLMGENYSEEYEEDIKLQDIKKTFLSCGRYRIEVNGLPAGSIGLISGHDIDTFISKTATIYGTEFSNHRPLHITKPLNRIFDPVFKVAVQPANPSDLSKFVEGLKRLIRSYIGSEIKVEEGGEYVIMGYGELYFDCLLHDLRHLYTDIEIKVSDPMARFSETCVDMSMVKLDVESNNGKNQITIVSEPMDPRIGRDIEDGIISINLPARQLAKHFKNDYQWDALAARSIWGFGPNDDSAAILCDDTLPDEVDKERLLSVKDSIKQGFKWATREGPLCDEPIRDVKFRILDIQLSDNQLESNGAQIIQMVRKACYTSLMTASPRLLEPVYEVEIICFSHIVSKLTKLLDKRRGNIVTDKPIDGTQLYKVFGFVPVIESVGLETDIRLLTQGQAMCQLVFSRWQVVPGDPLDSSTFIPLLKPAPINSLARDFTIKTRKRKGLDDEPSIKKYVDIETYSKLQAAGLFD